MTHRQARRLETDFAPPARSSVNRRQRAQDAIYRLVGSAAWGEQEVLVPLRDDYHADEPSRSRDRSGKNALVFDPFWYWGGFGIPAPEEIADLAHYYIGQSAKNSSPEKIALLEAWVRSVADPGIHGKPRDPSQWLVLGK